MSHVIDRGRLDGLRTSADLNGEALLTIAYANGEETDHVVSADVASAIAADGLLFADVELTLSRAGEPASPVADERRRYLAELDRATRLERALADAEQRERELRAEVAALCGVRARLLARIDAADVERVTLATLPLRGVLRARGMIAHHRQDGAVEVSDFGCDAASQRRLASWQGDTVRVVVERVRGGQRAEDAREGDADVAGEHEQADASGVHGQRLRPGAAGAEYAR